MKAANVAIRALGALAETTLRLVYSLGSQGVIINNHTQDSGQIRRQVDALHRYFDFIHHDELVQRAAAGKKPFCLITFDDGKRVNRDAADTLKQLGVPAVFYVVTDFVGSEEPLWFDHLAAIRREMGDRVAAFGLDRPKLLNFQELCRRISAAAEESGVHADLSDPRVGPLSWDDVVGLDRDGFTVGAHTTQHAILTNESRADAELSIRESISRVADAIGHACTSFAFTNGNFTPALAAFAKRCGVQTVMTTEPTWVSKHDPMHLLPRVQLHEKQSNKLACAKLSVSRAGALLSDPNGTGRRYVWNRMRRRLMKPGISL